MAECKKPIRFWGTFVALCILSLVFSLDVAITMTALPSITAEIGGAHRYVWVAKSFVVASSVPQPPFGQLANVFGCRLPFIGSTVLFAVGNGVVGGASSVGMLIADRTIRGVGTGSIYVLLDIACCDLVPLL
jgi:MFS family permease